MNVRTPLTLLVGPESRQRDAVAQRLVERGWSFVLCSGEGGCPLPRDTRCALVDVADVAIFMPPRFERHDVATQLWLCARSARVSVNATSRRADDVIDAVDEALLRGERVTEHAGP